MEICFAKLARFRSRNLLFDFYNKFLRVSISFHKFQFVIFCLFFFVLSGCATVYNPATQRKESIFIDSAQEVQIGRSMSELLIKKEYRPLNDPAKQLFVNKVANKIVAACDRKDIMYHFMVLDSPDLNAFALPGGYVYIFSGLFNKLDEPELAAILAHEVGHVAAKHSVKKMQTALGYDLLIGLVLLGLGNKDPVLDQDIAAVSNTVFDLLSRGYGREDELMADKLSVRYLRRCGYNPKAMVEVLELLDKEKGPSGRVFEILSTHPRMEERIKKVKEEIEQTK